MRGSLVCEDPQPCALGYKFPRTSSVTHGMSRIKNTDFLLRVFLGMMAQWFDTIFDLKCDEAVSFSTGPHTTETHWKQCAFYLSKPVDMQPGSHMRTDLQSACL
jgi:hypothetical protein